MVQLFKYMKYIIHIKQKNDNRPEPCFELNTKDIIEISNKQHNDLEIECIRDKNA